MLEVENLFIRGVRRCMILHREACVEIFNAGGRKSLDLP